MTKRVAIATIIFSAAALFAVVQWVIRDRPVPAPDPAQSTATIRPDHAWLPVDTVEPSGVVRPVVQAIRDTLPSGLSDEAAQELNAVLHTVFTADVAPHRESILAAGYPVSDRGERYLTVSAERRNGVAPESLDTAAADLMSDLHAVIDGVAIESVDAEWYQRGEPFSRVAPDDLNAGTVMPCAWEANWPPNLNGLDRLYVEFRVRFKGTESQGLVCLTFAKPPGGSRYLLVTKQLWRASADSETAEPLTQILSLL